MEKGNLDNLLKSKLMEYSFARRQYAEAIIMTAKPSRGVELAFNDIYYLRVNNVEVDDKTTHKTLIAEVKIDENSVHLIRDHFLPRAG